MPLSVPFKHGELGMEILLWNSYKMVNLSHFAYIVYQGEKFVRHDSRSYEQRLLMIFIYQFHCWYIRMTVCVQLKWLIFSK